VAIHATLASKHGRELDHSQCSRALADADPLRGLGAYFVYVLSASALGSPASYAGAHSHACDLGRGCVLVVEIALLVAFSIPAGRAGHQTAGVETRWRIRIARAVCLEHSSRSGRCLRTHPGELLSATNPMGLIRRPAGKDDIITLNQLHLRSTGPVIIRLTSKDGHPQPQSPVMRVKQDAIRMEARPVTR